MNYTCGQKENKNETKNEKEMEVNDNVSWFASNKALILLMEGIEEGGVNCSER